jgi:hypothetical protein
MAREPYPEDCLPVIRAVEPWSSESEPKAIDPPRGDPRPRLSLRDPCFESLEAVHARIAARPDFLDPVYAADELDWELRGDNIRSKQRSTLDGLRQALNPLGYWEEWMLRYSAEDGLGVYWRRNPTGPKLTNVAFSLYRHDVNQHFPPCAECEEQGQLPRPAGDPAPEGKQSPVTREELFTYFDEHRGPGMSNRDFAYGEAREHFKGRLVTVKRMAPARKAAMLAAKWSFGPRP